MRIDICSQHVYVHLTNYLYRLRMAESHMEAKQQQLGWSREDVFVLQLLTDLRRAAEDATEIVREALVPAGSGTPAEDGMGEDRC